ncbi:glycosyltransferase family 2 protein [uncultured Jatrophihabitans sp.]|uniref:glycosyltransferase family 2 protein n=1 Tax=uncultured Jatrophihabitans sp. TaxID=1610747 RepID=UPI0035CA0BFC
MGAERTAVVTVVSGRHEHLAVQRHHLARCDPAPLLHVVVAVADPEVAGVVAREPDLLTRVVALDTIAAGLPVAAARNAGAAEALAAGATELVFLDVDCLPAPDLLEHYTEALTRHTDAVLCGPVTYLPPLAGRDWRVDDPTLLRAPHAARPDPAPGAVLPLDAALFWSLSFALTAGTWARLGGFWAGYVGYGAEDTDFGVHVVTSGVPLLMVGGADAYHQHHPVSRPPVEHVDDIVRNSEVYLRRNGSLPMSGWLDAFAADGLVETGPTGAPRRTDAPRVVTVPARHPYLDAVLPASVVRVAPDRVTAWEPDPLLDADALADAADGIDVVHVHFGYDHVDPDALDGWLARLDELGLALAVTVHDLRNPHHADRRRHDAHLSLLLQHAQRALTLTDAAADECRRRFGRRPEVVVHPTLLSAADVGAALGRPPADPPTVLVPLKALRRNVVDPDAVVGAAVQGAADARVVVLVQPSVAERPELAGTRAAAARGELTLLTREYLPPDELHALVAAAHAVVLPYRWGTHSGWAELARDLGTHVIAPSSGHVASQLAGAAVYGNDETAGLDPAGLRAAVADVVRRPAAVPADRAAREVERDLVRATHDVLYRDLARQRSRPARVP